MTLSTSRKDTSESVFLALPPFTGDRLVVTCHFKFRSPANVTRSIEYSKGALMVQSSGTEVRPSFKACAACVSSSTSLDAVAESGLETFRAPLRTVHDFVIKVGALAAEDVLMRV